MATGHPRGDISAQPVAPCPRRVPFHHLSRFKGHRDLLKKGLVPIDQGLPVDFPHADNPIVGNDFGVILHAKGMTRLKLRVGGDFGGRGHKNGNGLARRVAQEGKNSLSPQNRGDGSGFRHDGRRSTWNRVFQELPQRHSSVHVGMALDEPRAKDRVAQVDNLRSLSDVQGVVPPHHVSDPPFPDPHTDVFLNVPGKDVDQAFRLENLVRRSLKLRDLNNIRQGVSRYRYVHASMYPLEISVITIQRGGLEYKSKTRNQSPR